MTVQIIQKDGRPEWAVIPYHEYERMREQLDELADIRAYDQAKGELASGADETVPTEVVQRLTNGDNPLRVWREYRGMTQQMLAETAGIGQSDLSQLEAGTTTAAIGTLRALAAALAVDLDDLEDWDESDRNA
jgi:DNA-binding XRE family transcriptional regulator